MLHLECLDGRFKAHLPKLKKLTLLLLRRLESGKLKSLKKFPKKSKFYLELYIVNKKTLNKNVYAYEFPKNFPFGKGDLIPLGEIYLNPALIKSQKLSLEHMLIHGFLHLLGYEHKSKNDTIAMETKETQLLKELSLI